MTKVTWDGAGQRKYDYGVDHGILFPRGGDGVAFNGLTNVTETPAGADNNKFYADNMVYAAIRAAETFGGTIEAYMCPIEFLECDGFRFRNGVAVGQQPRKGFDLFYRTNVGNDENPEDGYKYHFVYGATTSPSERSHDTVNESPEPTQFSWEFDTVPVSFEDHDDLKSVSYLEVDSTNADVDATQLAALLDIVQGTESDDPRMPTPDEVLEVMGTGLTSADTRPLDNQPSYDDATHVVTLPAVTGVVWYVDGEETAAGALPALSVGETVTINADQADGYNLVGDDEWVFSY